MTKYILKRLGQMLVVVLLVSIATFMLVDLVPGDPVYIVAGSEEIDDETYDKIYQELNLDKSPVERYLIWIKGALHGDFGKSYIYTTDVWTLIKPRAAATFYLATLSLIISVPIGVVCGIISAVYRKKWPDTLITLTANVSNCLPQFWVGILLMYLFCYVTHILPTMGFGWPSEVGWGMHIKTIIMPITCLALNCIAGFARQTRSSMLEVIRQDYIRTARAKGLSEKKVYFKHMMKNGLIPVITAIGNRLARLLGGSMIVETVFGIPGMGVLARTAVMSKDVPLIQAIVLLTSMVACLAFILTDIAYTVVDPRITLTESHD